MTKKRESKRIRGGRKSEEGGKEKGEEEEEHKLGQIRLFLLSLSPFPLSVPLLGRANFLPSRRVISQRFMRGGRERRREGEGEIRVSSVLLLLRTVVHAIPYTRGWMEEEEATLFFLPSSDVCPPPPPPPSLLFFLFHLNLLLLLYCTVVFSPPPATIPTPPRLFSAKCGGEAFSTNKISSISFPSSLPCNFLTAYDLGL